MAIINKDNVNCSECNKKYTEDSFLKMEYIDEYGFQQFQPMYFFKKEFRAKGPPKHNLLFNELEDKCFCSPECSNYYKWKEDEKK